MGKSSSRGQEPTMMGESRGFSRVAGGSLGFLSSYNGELRESPVLPQRSPVSIPVAMGSVDCFRVTAGESGLNSCRRVNLKIFLVSGKGEHFMDSQAVF